MIGDYFYGEVGRAHRSAPAAGQDRRPDAAAERLSAVRVHGSTDPLFRPVDMTTAPDGTMYITDMYRGIIQESQWSGPGTYLRQKIDQYAARQGRAATGASGA